MSAPVTNPTVLIRPKRSLLRAAMLTFWVTSVPVFGVLYWYGATRGTWLLVLYIHIIVAAVSASLFFRQLIVFSAVTEHNVEGNGIFSPLESVPRTQVGSVVMVPVYVRNSLDVSNQLVVLDTRGHCLYRMRGQFWNDDDLRRFGLTASSIFLEEQLAISDADFFERFPGAEYWFENSALVRSAGIVVILVAAGLLAIGLMALIGGPLSA